MRFDWHVLVRYYPILLDGLRVTIEYTAIALVLCLALGIVIGTLRSQRIRYLDSVLRAYTTFFRETPLLAQLYFMFYALPHLGIYISAPVSGILAIVLNDGAFITEMVRGGIQGVPGEQVQAAQSLAMSKTQVLRFVVLPQALRSVLPSILGQASYILKDTSLLTLIAIRELTGAAEYINNMLYEPGTAFFSAAILYIGAFYIITLLASRLKGKGRGHGFS